MKRACSCDYLCFIFRSRAVLLVSKLDQILPRVVSEGITWQSVWAVKNTKKKKKINCVHREIYAKLVLQFPRSLGNIDPDEGVRNPLSVKRI